MARYLEMWNIRTLFTANPDPKYIKKWEWLIVPPTQTDEPTLLNVSCAPSWQQVLERHKILDNELSRCVPKRYILFQLEGTSVVDKHIYWADE